MTAAPLAPTSDRLVSLDVFRGLTIAAMVFVNNPGEWGSRGVWGPFGHAPWHGYTPTDFIFPFFLFIVGVAMTFSFDKRLARGDSKVELMAQVVRRAIILILLGMIMAGFPNFRLTGPFILFIVALGLFFHDEPIFKIMTESVERNTRKIGGIILGMGAILWFVLDFQHFQGRTAGASWDLLFPLTNEPEGASRSLRVPGVLQRIGLCYLAASVIMLFFQTWGRIAWSVVLLVGYWLILRYVQAPEGFEMGSGPRQWTNAPVDDPWRGEIVDWLDIKLLGAHLYGERPDPEGLLSTLPAIVTVLLGVFTGTVLRSKQMIQDKLVWMFVAGNLLIAAGYIWGLDFPYNKKIWTSSYVLLMAGIGMQFLGVCVYFVDVRGWKRVTTPFVVFGTNAIFVFFMSGIVARAMGATSWTTVAADGTEKSLNVKSWLYETFFTSWIENSYLASHGFAFVYIFVWLLLTWPLYHKKWFFKI